MGGRGSSLLNNLLDIDGVEIKAVCDTVLERVKSAQRRVAAKGQAEPAGYSKDESDFENLCQRTDLDLVYIATPWDWHVRMAVSAMKNGKHAAVEVPAVGGHCGTDPTPLHDAGELLLWGNRTEALP